VAEAAWYGVHQELISNPEVRGEPQSAQRSQAATKLKPCPGAKAQKPSGFEHEERKEPQRRNRLRFLTFVIFAFFVFKIPRSITKFTNPVIQRKPITRVSVLLRCALSQGEAVLK
jgi:hypothetical protein